MSILRYTRMLTISFIILCLSSLFIFSAKAAPKNEQTMSLAELRKKYPEYLILNGRTDEKIVALTFDDAPDPRFTGAILDELKRHQVKATFFVVGYRAEKYPELVKRMEREGHAIGNHSYNHPLLTKLSAPAFERQMNKTQSILKPLIGYEPRLFRPPYGEVNEEQLKWAVKHNYTVVNWNVDSLDWKNLDADEVTNNILEQVGPGAIILQHAGGGVGGDLTGTVKAIPRVIETLKAQGYHFMTIPDLLDVPVEK